MKLEREAVKRAIGVFYEWLYKLQNNRAANDADIAMPTMPIKRINFLQDKYGMKLFQANCNIYAKLAISDGGPKNM